MATMERSALAADKGNVKFTTAQLVVTLVVADRKSVV